MEVHKHPHHVSHKKKWNEYLLEFFMLFLAVFLGFVAENVRENIADNHKEKEYMRSLIQDLKTDTANLSRVMRSYTYQFKYQDSLLLIFDSINTGYNKNFFGLSPSIEGFADFVYTDATMQQLKSSGGFRLIRNKKVVDSINAYTSAVNKTFINTDDLGKLAHELQESYFNFINYEAIDKALHSGMSEDQMQTAKTNVLISHNKEEREKFYSKIVQFRSVMHIIHDVNFTPLKQRATRLISLLQKEYHLENELNANTN